ncbi:hypothetical protein D3C77_575990 [compost metagenome]
MILEAFNLRDRTCSVGSFDHAAFFEQVDFFRRNPRNQFGNFSDFFMQMTHCLLLIGDAIAFPGRLVMEDPIAEIPDE